MFGPAGKFRVITGTSPYVPRIFSTDSNFTGCVCFKKDPAGSTLTIQVVFQGPIAYGSVRIEDVTAPLKYGSHRTFRFTIGNTDCCDDISQLAAVLFKDLSRIRTKLLGTATSMAFDSVATAGCGSICPLFR